MTMPLDTIVGELYLIQGVPQPEAPHITAQTPPRRANRDRRQDTLFVFLDLGPQSSASLAQEVIEQIAKIYWSQPGGITMGLRRAIGAGNAYLLEHNRSLPVGQRYHGGVVCAVLRQNDLYVAHAGPARGVWQADGQIHHVPDRSHTQNEHPLGVAQGIDIRYTHSQVASGDLILLTGDRWGQALPTARLEAILNLGNAQTALAALESQVGPNSASTLVIECVDRSELETEPLRDVMPQPGDGQLVVEDEQLGKSWLPDLSTKDLPPHWQTIRQRATNVGSALGAGARTLLERVLPEPEPPPPHRRGRHKRRTVSESTTRLIGLAIAIPLIVAFIVAILYMQQGDTASQQGDLKQARDAFEAAQAASASDPQAEATYALWQTAWAKLHQVWEANPDNEQVERMYRQAQAALDSFEGVQRPPLSLLWNYGPGGSRFLAASRISLYVLDSAANQVLRHDLNETRDGTLQPEPALIAYEGELVGDQVMGEPAYLVWLQAGGARTQDALFILTAENELLEYNQSWGLKRVTFDTGLTPISVRALKDFDGKLYILDPTYNQIWRFPSTGDTFGPPEGYFATTPSDLSQAIDLAIDGAVYVLLQDGQIYKFWGGQPQPFEITGLSQPLVRPVAMVVEGDQESGALYVADAGAERIVVLDKNGGFISQFRADQDLLNGLESLDIDEDNRVLYLSANGRLYSMPLPLATDPNE